MVSTAGSATQAVQNAEMGRPDGESGDDESPVVVGGDAAEDGQSLSRDDLFEALDNRRRRYAIHYLQQRADEGSVDLSDVSTQVAAWELDEEPGRIGYSDRKNVHTALYQFHAPKLDNLGLVRYNKRRGTIELTEHGENLWVEVGCAETASAGRSRHAPLAVCAGGLALAAWLAVTVAGSAAVALLVALGVGFWSGTRYGGTEQRERSVVEECLPAAVVDD